MAVFAAVHIRACAESDKKYGEIRKMGDACMKRLLHIARTCMPALLACILLLAGAVPSGAQTLTANLADDEGQGYATVLYDRDSGLPTSEANDIIQSEDGFLWIASYGGLVRYDGSTFYQYDASTGASGTICLYIDSKQRLWGGTSDKGVFMLEHETFTYFTTADGLTSSFVNAICEDEAGNILVGTTRGMCYIDPEMQVHQLDDERLNKSSIYSMERGEDGLIYGCTHDDHCLFTIRDLAIADYYTGDELGIASPVQSLCLDPEEPGKVYIGTSSTILYHGPLKKGIRWSLIDTRGLNTVNRLKAIGDTIWICSDKGIGSLQDERVTVLNKVEMNSSVFNAIQDYQGNLWFVSTRQGVMKIVHNPFVDLTQRAGLNEMVVNTTCRYGSDLYVGTDSGLHILNSRNVAKSTSLTEYLSGKRIRCIRRDSAGNLWLATRSDRGLVCYNGETDTFQAYHPSNGKLDTETTRVVMERQDGTIAVSSSEGVRILSDGKVVKSFTRENGVETEQILCMEETADGTLLMGSDGGGIYVEDGDHVRHIGKANGLESEVILRIKKDPVDPELLWIITGSSIAYMRDEQVTTLHEFPYANNFDIFFADEGGSGSIMTWVLSSSGIYVVRRDDLLSDAADMAYTFLDSNCGLPFTATANSYSDIEEDGTLYIAGYRGVCRIDIDERIDESAPLKMAVPYLLADDEYVWPENGTFTIDADCKRLTIPAYIFTYTLENPHIRYGLEGFDPEPLHGTRDSLSSLSYTNLRGGTYRFHMAAINTGTGEVKQSIEVTIIKKKAVYEKLWFWLLVLGGTAVLTSGLLLLYFARKNAKEKEKERVRAEEELAAHVQTGSLPAVFPAFPDRHEFDIYATMHPARQVGGDFYDFFLVDDNHLAMVMADVSGKGFPAALFMMKTKTLIQNRTQLLEDFSPGAVLTDVNDQVCDNNEADMFVTVWMAILDLRTGEGLAANAGHEHPVLRRKGGQYELVKYRHSLALGAMEGLPFREHSFRMEPGDTLFVYTDGVPESNDKDGKFFGTDRMLEALNGAETDDLKKTAESVKRHIDAFSGDAPQFDDITMLVFRYNGPEKSAEPKDGPIVRETKNNGSEQEAELILDADLERLNDVIDFVTERLERAGSGELEKNQIQLAVEELFVNIASYAYGPEGGKASIRICTGGEPVKAWITLTDSGMAFDPLNAKTPDITLSVEERPIGGLGVYMVRQMMDSVTYEYKDGKNVLTIEKTLVEE